jgi:hypothetical protein
VADAAFAFIDKNTANSCSLMDGDAQHMRTTSAVADCGIMSIKKQ